LVNTFDAKSIELPTPRDFSPDGMIAFIGGPKLEQLEGNSLYFSVKLKWML
jgi:hypothetical protein